MRICYTQILIFVSLEASLEVDLSSTLDQISMSLYSLHHLYLSYNYIKKKKKRLGSRDLQPCQKYSSFFNICY